ncbi:uncharacterized protein LOC123260171 isoform X1 [Cotesia glomerata]|uniref:Myb/SANT-like DNA-binding domain-containing protein n=1 Tax=Cotesia glomerata TaxID=32391 RepID=A0AAV7I009_COTGL|nr:uncharacterized protein LOC123260171 isoform X1 [Cotesia glomerata]KAH0540053.1 hypothetical protein KQX54_011763 [Cotesia glomerata]
MDKGLYFCKHCNGLIESFNEAGSHPCFRGKEHIYQDEEDDTILFVYNYKNKNKENHEGQVLNYKESEILNSFLSGDTGCIESDEDLSQSANFKTESNPKKSYARYIESDEDLSQSTDLKTESNPKKNAVWTKQSTMAMLSLYEANVQMLMDVGAKSRVWKKISEGLKDLCIQVTADQVKWKFNRLYNKYKECIDNNNKSGSNSKKFFIKKKMFPVHVHFLLRYLRQMKKKENMT